MSSNEKKSIMRCVGEFFGHVGRAIRTKPTQDSECSEIRRTVEETEEGEVTLRRTTIEEVEFKTRSTSHDSRKSVN